MSEIKEVTGFNFPNIFKGGNSVSILQGKEDIIKDLKLLFESETREFRFDPGYGCNVKLLKYKPKNSLTINLLIDAIIETQMFMPNVMFDRNSVKISYIKPGQVNITISAIIGNNNYITELVILQENI